jgi:hypothetical protein
MKNKKSSTKYKQFNSIYKCQENDAIIELGIHEDEILVKIDGERNSTIIGLKDLFKALEYFNVIATAPYEVDLELDSEGDVWFNIYDTTVHTEKEENIIEVRKLEPNKVHNVLLVTNDCYKHEDCQ